MSNTILLSKEERDNIRRENDAFTTMLDKFPQASILEKTPDGRAVTLPISHVESRLDTFFFGQWGTEDFNWQVCQNEILGKITLWVIHPVTGLKITRVGSASVQITVDALEQEIKSKMTKKEINSYALNVENKKPNSLKLLAGVLKAECFKNAAQSFGKALGKDINRKAVATFQRLSKDKPKIESLPESDAVPMPSSSEIKKCLTLCERNLVPDFLKQEFVKQTAQGVITLEIVQEILTYEQ